MSLENLDQLIEAQREHARAVSLEDEGQLIIEGVAVDVQYDGELAYLGAARFDSVGVSECYVARSTTTTPYHPGLFALREGPVLSAIVAALPAPTPRLIVVDGHGIAHPRRFGVASYLGLARELPTVGIAKDTLVQYSGSLGPARGDSVEVTVDGEVVGHALRTRDDIKPLFVSPGHRMSVARAKRIALALPSVHRISEPQRAADRVCRALSRGETPEAIDLGTLTPVSL